MSSPGEDTEAAGVGVSQLWEVIGQSTINKGKFVMHISLYIFSTNKFLEIESSGLFLVQRGRYPPKVITKGYFLLIRTSPLSAVS